MRIAISSEPKLLPILRGAVRWQALEHGFPEADADGLALAIDEAAGKVIACTYAGPPGMLLSLEIVAYPDRMEFLLEDLGPKVKAKAPRLPSPDDIPPGGSGTSFQTTFNAIYYDPSYGAGNRLKLVKFLPGKVAGTE
ncbi:MAG TPA: ATP-binding protein [Terriglobia bacterium]|nr:ATP-binding protein [Terriglobia bacterium]